MLHTAFVPCPSRAAIQIAVSQMQDKNNMNEKARLRRGGRHPIKRGVNCGSDPLPLWNSTESREETMAHDASISCCTRREEVTFLYIHELLEIFTSEAVHLTSPLRNKTRGPPALPNLDFQRRDNLSYNFMAHVHETLGLLTQYIPCRVLSQKHVQAVHASKHFQRHQCATYKRPCGGAKAGSTTAGKDHGSEVPRLRSKGKCHPPCSHMARVRDKPFLSNIETGESNQENLEKRKIPLKREMTIIPAVPLCINCTRELSAWLICADRLHLTRVSSANLTSSRQVLNMPAKCEQNIS